MALTDPQKQASLLKDSKFWLPEENVLDDDGLLMIINFTITDVGSLDPQYAEVLCKSLDSIAVANQAKYNVDTATIKSEKAGGVATTWDTDTNRDPWKEYRESLKDLCPIFGYTLKSSPIGIKISPSVTPDINPDCPDSTTIINDSNSFFL